MAELAVKIGDFLKVLNLGRIDFQNFLIGGDGVGDVLSNNVQHGLLGIGTYVIRIDLAPHFQNGQGLIGVLFFVVVILSFDQKSRALRKSVQVFHGGTDGGRGVFHTADRLIDSEQQKVGK